ncbi:hypothetical protein GGI07_002881 [Coemansia sp. Benny D115]|nr:hypothetical protein GGI07_002881 [Coemansia sp. Benny D115]
MQCGVCHTPKSKSYCGLCVQDRLCQHNWVLGLVRSAGHSAGAPGWSQLQQQQQQQQQQQKHAYLASRIQQRRQRIAGLRALIAVRQRQVAAVQQIGRRAADANGRRQQHLCALEQSTVADDNKRVDEAHEALRRQRASNTKMEAALRGDRGILAGALCQVVGLQLELEADPFLAMADSRRLFGLPWPGDGDWAKYPREYVNACVGHCVHVFSVLAHYLHVDLPFRVVRRGARLFIRPHLRQVDGGEALLSVAGEGGVPSFVAGLSMLFFNVACLAHAMGVVVPLEQATDVVDNLRLIVLALSDDPPPPPPRSDTLALDMYAVAQETVRMYVGVGGARELALRQQVDAVLRALHLCDDAIDSIDHDEDNWAII